VRVFNTLSGAKEEFAPARPPVVSMYVCGVTPYDMSHLGHARTYVTFDVVSRYLRARGFEVKYVRNFTDVEDKIIKKGNTEGVAASEIAERYIAEYYKDMASLGVSMPELEPRVSTSMPEIIELIERLIKAGSAYVIDGDVYFAVGSFPTYLKLSKRSFDEMEAGARVEVDERKKNPMDFALWKSAKPGEPTWDSPWGKGRPGWHIECSAMAFAHLGETIDIHGGGRDLIFPHHENEIAQAEAASHVPFAKYWLHAGMLNIDDTKMSKSLGNFFTIREVLKHVDAEAMRLFFLTAHYRSPLNFELDHSASGEPIFVGIEQAEKRLGYIYRTLQRVDTFVQGASAEGSTFRPELVEGTWPAYCKEMDDDFNTAAAISSLSPVLSYLNELVDKPPKPRDQAQRTAARLAKELRRCGAVLGLFTADPHEKTQARQRHLIRARSIDVAHVEALLNDRQAARAEKRFTDADALRAQLTALGIWVTDGAQGSHWEVADD
jgi:cysteinyl-tRNA synthetase